MSKEHFIKLKGITEFVNDKTIVFIIPKDILEGVQDPHIVFDYAGEIVEIKASVTSKGLEPTPIWVQKSANFADWFNVTDNPIMIRENNNLDDQSHTLTAFTVQKGDIFRLNIPSFSVDAQNLSVNVKIMLTDSLNS